MGLPPLVHYSTEMEYRVHFERVYCSEPIITFDGIYVMFSKTRFDHCFFESSRRDGSKDRFSLVRAERIDWIKATLQHPEAELYQGWDKAKRRHDPTHRVSVVYGDYVVVIRVRKKMGGKLTAEFRTAYVADNSIGKIRSSPKWVLK